MASAMSPYVSSNNPLLLPLISIIVVITFALTNYALSVFSGPLAKIPGPKSRAFSVLPHLRAMWTGNEAASVVDLHQKYGPVVRLAPDLVAFVGSGQTWKSIYASKSHGISAFPKDYIFYDSPANDVPGPFGSDDHTNTRMRKTMAPAFSDAGLKNYEPRFKKWCEALAKRLTQHAEDGSPADMVKLFNCTTFDVLSDMLLSEPLHLLERGDYVPFVRLIFKILRHVTRLKTLRYYNRTFARQLHVLMMKIPRVRQLVEQHHRFVTDKVDERLSKSPSQPDIWSLVIAETKTASMISDEERYSIANELMIAGTETTATVLSGCLYLLLANPVWLEALTEDLRTRYSWDQGGGTSDMTMSSLQANRLLEAILKESMRIYPPVPVGFARYVPPGGTQLNGYYLPEGTRAVIYQLATYRDTNLWHDAKDFHPERWLGGEKFKGDQLDALKPFSTGPRGCSGENFAWHEMRLVLATTLLEFDFELRNESNNWLDQKVFMVWEKPALWVNVKRRIR